MTLDALVMLSGALVAFLSVAGFPPSIYKPLFFLLGLVTIGLGIVVRRKRGQWESEMRRHGSTHEQVAPSHPHEEQSLA